MILSVYCMKTGNQWVLGRYMASVEAETLGSGPRNAAVVPSTYLSTINQMWDVSTLTRIR